MRFTVILGSIRVDRMSARPANFVAQKLRDHGHEVDFLDLRELSFPLFEGTDEQRNLECVHRLLESMRTADGVVVIFPEYNHNVCPALTNAFNYLENRELMHKPLGLVPVSSGTGGVRAGLIARGTFPTLGAAILPTIVPVTNVSETFAEEMKCSNPKIEGFFTDMLNELVVYGSALGPVRKHLKEGGSIFINI